MHRAGEIDEVEIDEVGGKLAPTAGTCMVMGTASTMACMTEALGMMIPGGAAIPAVAADRLRHAEAAGARAVEMAEHGPTPDQIMTPEAFANAFRVLLAIGGSTNGLVHMTAVAGRLGIAVDMEALDRMGQETPVLVDLKPSGQHYMEDLQKAGGLVTVLRELRPLLHLDCLTVTGRSLGNELVAAAPPWKQDVVRPFDPDLEVGPDDVLVMKNAGPKGAPGMPESGYLPIPKKLATAGVKDMLRMSDARMSGTAFGSIVLHITPESADGGPLALVQTGDSIKLDVPNRRLDLLVDDAELEQRRAAWTPPPPHEGSDRGYLKLYLDHVQQAGEGVDFDFLAKSPDGRKTPV
jgi:dihydroxy-acid dehydratase